jgi:hypothetical protein
MFVNPNFLTAKTTDERLAELKRATEKVPFFHVLTFDLGTRGTTIPQALNNFTREYEILSAITTMKKSKMSLKLNSDNLTDSFVPVRSICNLQGNNQPQICLPCPINTNSKSQLNVSILHDEVIAGKYDIVFYSQETESNFTADFTAKINDAKKFIAENKRTPFFAAVTIPLDLSNPTYTPKYTYINDEKPRLLWAISSTLKTAKIDMRTSWNNRPFSSNNVDIPIWAMAGNTASDFLSAFGLVTPLFVPPGGEIFGTAAQSGIAEKAGSITFHLTTV